MFNIKDAILKRLLLYSVRQECKSGFTNINHAIALFNKMTSLDPFPSPHDFNRLFTAISRMHPQRHHSVIVSLSKHLHSLPHFRPNKHSLGILANCYCHLGRVDFAFSLLGTRIKLGFDPDIVIYTTLINGLIDCNNDIGQAVKLLDKIVDLGIQPNIIAYGSIVKGLCRVGNNEAALNFVRKMQFEGVCKPDVVIYTTVMGSLCKGNVNMMPEVIKLLEEMQKDGVSPNVVTYTALVNGCCYWDK